MSSISRQLAILLAACSFLMIAAISPARAADPPNRAMIVTAQRAILAAAIAERDKLTNPVDLEAAAVEICRAQADVGDIAGAIATASKYAGGSKIWLDRCWEAIAEEAVPFRLDADARKLMRTIPDPYRQRYIAAEQACDGDFDGAFATISQFPEQPEHRNEELNRLIGRLISWGMEQPARRLCIHGGELLLRTPPDSYEPISRVLEPLVIADDFPAGFDLLNRITIPGAQPYLGRASLEREFVEGRGEANDLDGSRLVAGLVTDAKWLSELNQYLILWDLIAHAKAGDFATAQHLLATLEPVRREIGALRIAVWQAHYGDWPSARQTLSPFPGDAENFLRVAVALAQEGYVDEAKQAIDTALNHSKDTTIRSYSWGTEEFVEARALCGDIPGAIEAAHFVESVAFPPAPVPAPEGTPTDAVQPCEILCSTVGLLGEATLRKFRDLQIPEAQLYQVFPDAIDPKLPAQIDALIAKLDSDSPNDRDQAAAELIPLGPSAFAYIVHLDRTAFSLQQQQEIKLITLSIRAFSDAEIADRRRDPAFLAIALVNEDRRVRAAALDQLQKLLGHPVQFDLDGGIDARLDTIRAMGLFPHGRGN